jgi:hypothetical protein
MRKILFTLLFSFACSLSAQQKKDSVPTEIINVISSYNPSISDAFKAKDIPEIDNKNSSKKKPSYQIKSKRIHSLFQPDAGAYLAPLEEKFLLKNPNYLKVGYGNYQTPLLEAFVTKKVEQHDVSFLLFNRASGGGIPDVVLNDNYINTKLGLRYKNEQQDHTWTGKVNYQKDSYNWYGLPSNIDFDSNVIESIEEKQSFRHFTMGGSLLLKQGSLKKTEVSFHFFSDRFDSKETQIHLQPSFSFLLGKKKLSADLSIDILNGSFENNFEGNNKLNYGQLTFSAKASYPIAIYDFYLNIGTQLVHNSDTEKNTQQFYIYPDIRINYSPRGDLLKLYTGVNGGLTQNAYRSFVASNSYVSPSLHINPTQNKFHLFAGAKGTFSSIIAYHIKASLRHDNNRALFQLNPNLSDGTNSLAKGYQYGNSFNVVYDAVKTFRLYSQFQTELMENLNTGLRFCFQYYDTDTQKEAWNLPNFHTTLFASYERNKWSYTSEIFVLGKRKDRATREDLSQVSQQLKAFADVNFSAQYRFHSNWNASLEIHNLLNQNYARFANFNVQGFQLLAGISYQFDLKK